ncbi:hypothetical protein QYF36_002048 [Acer negundo]|nr:hypothetical protein QYF36_002048 [Acer negundo]
MDGGYGYEISSASDDEPMRKLFARESFNPMPQAFLPSRLNNIIRLGTNRQSQSLHRYTLLSGIGEVGLTNEDSHSIRNRDSSKNRHSADVRKREQSNQKYLS